MRGEVFAGQPNNTFDRTAGSHSLAAAGHRDVGQTTDVRVAVVTIGR